MDYGHGADIIKKTSNIDIMMNAEKIIEELGMLPHPEGGYYKETYRCNEKIATNDKRQRNVCTAIYFLLRNDEKSHLHRIKSDEIWFFHQGESLEIILFENGQQHSTILGNDLEKGEVPQVLIPANTWFGAQLKDKNDYALVSCTVSPGFDFEDFDLAKKDDFTDAELKNIEDLIY